MSSVPTLEVIKFVLREQCLNYGGLVLESGGLYGVE